MIPRILLASAMTLIASGAQAEDTVRSYRLQSPSGQTVQCTIRHRNGVEQREIVMSMGQTYSIDRAPTLASWAASGCLERVAAESRPISAEEQERRFEAIRKGPSYAGPGGLREQLVDLMCSDARNASSKECLGRPAK